MFESVQMYSIKISEILGLMNWIAQFLDFKTYFPFRIIDGIKHSKIFTHIQ